MSEQVIENKNLKRAGLIATIGAGMLLVLQVLGMVVFFLNSKEMARSAYDITKKNTPDFPQTFEAYQPFFMTVTIVGFVITFAILLLILFFTLGLKKAKGRGKAITTTVLSSIFLLLAVIRLLTAPEITSIINIVSFGLVLTGSIMAISAPASEYEYNQLD